MLSYCAAMSKVSSEHKVRLLAEGKWLDFVAFRDQLKNAGATPNEANRRALDQFLGNSAKAASGSTVLEGGTAAPEASGDRQENPPPLAPPAERPNGSAVMSDFEGKEAGEVEIIRWVARYMDVSDVKPTDCPDPAAWSLLWACRRSPIFATEFWRSMYTKIIPSRSQLDAKPGDELDGTPLVATINRILDAREKALKGAA